MIRNPPTSISGQSTIGKGWEYGDTRSPRFYQPVVDIFLELNNHEWIEEQYSGVETVRKEPPANQQPEIVLTNVVDETEHNLIIPSEEKTAEILKECLKNSYIPKSLIDLKFQKINKPLTLKFRNRPQDP